MRTEAEMTELIVGFARMDERVRAVAMNGSRTNPNAPRDLFQDYDIVYLVHEIESFVRDPHWVDRFGERIIMQTPDAMPFFPSERGSRFAYLMLFADGNRIDLTLVPMAEKEAYLQEDRLTVVLLDKDDSLPPIPAPTDEAYWVKPPSAADFANCCNEFWWVSTYVAKGLWRGEILYALEHLNAYVRPMLIHMLNWHVGIRTEFGVSTGKCGKYLKKHLSERRWRQLLATYSDGDEERAWQALLAMGDLFRETAVEVAERFRFDYPHEDDRRVSAYLRRVQALPPDAADM
jgi:aminoglycoside 6-adenylyltransferase